jgi:cytoskeletal protein RodZ
MTVHCLRFLPYSFQIQFSPLETPYRKPVSLQYQNKQKSFQIFFNQLNIISMKNLINGTTAIALLFISHFAFAQQARSQAVNNATAQVKKHTGTHADPDDGGEVTQSKTAAAKTKKAIGIKADPDDGGEVTQSKAATAKIKKPIKVAGDPDDGGEVIKTDTKKP